MPAFRGTPMSIPTDFGTEMGPTLDPDNWTKRVFLPMLEEAGLPRIGLHTLRHTYASLLINQGENIKFASRQLGHASIQITADLYGHLFKETSLAAMRRLEQGMISRTEERHRRQDASQYRSGGTD
jgi:integrase